MQEYDLKMMALAIFLPAAFGLLALVFPRRWTEPVKWFALLGSAATLTLSLCLLVDYYALLDSRLDPAGRPLHSPETGLEWRVLDAQQAAAKPVPGPRLSNDWVARYKWIDRFGIDFAVGIDGLSLALVILSAFVIFFAVIASWKVEQNAKLYFALILFLETGVIGSLLATDFFLFYVFSEITLVPLYFLIGLWGGGLRRDAALQFRLYSMAGSVLLLIAMIGLYFMDVRDFVDQNAVAAKAEEIRMLNPALTAAEAEDRVAINTFDIFTHQRVGQAAAVRLYGGGDDLRAWASLAERRRDPVKHYLLGPGATPERAEVRFAQPVFAPAFQYVLFLLLFTGFAVKMSIFPLHGWLSAAHAEAPTPARMILAGVLPSLGAYGLLRFAYPMCPYVSEQLASWIALLGISGIVYGALTALGQTDFKKMLAYNSISQMGYVVLGIAVWAGSDGVRHWALAMNGAVFLVVAHGLSAAGLTFAAGVLTDRTQHCDIDRFGGVWNTMPLFGGLSAVLFFAAMGLPGLCGFIGLFAVVLGTWAFSPAIAIAAILTTVLTAATMLRSWQRIFLGPRSSTAEMLDVSTRETIVLLGFALPAVALGVYPSAVLSWLEPTVSHIAETLSRLK